MNLAVLLAALCTASCTAITLAPERPKPQLQRANKALALRGGGLAQDVYSDKDCVAEILATVVARDPDQPEFIQAVTEVIESLEPVLKAHPKYLPAARAIVEPERVIQFRIPWIDDKGVQHVNRGFRTQFNQAIGPFKGGLRFHPTVNLSILKFLGFEQVLKNSLTGLPMGGGKGGADFDPKGKTDAEVVRFCQSFMIQLFRHIGQFTDVPAGDIGVGGREIGAMFGMHKKLTNEFTGILTGKGLEWGGSLIRPEATGYGLVYFTREMLKTKGTDFKGKNVVLSGSGNVATYACEKVIDLGGKCITMSDSSGYITDMDGIDREKLAYIIDLKTVQRGRISDYIKKYPKAKFTAGCEGVWSVKADVALPCATQNEMDGEAAKKLTANGVIAVGEGANMPCTPEAVTHLQSKKVLFGPGKATNAGGVAVSGLEMSQNSLRLAWTREEVDGRLDTIMTDLHKKALDAAALYGKEGDYVAGANIAGFIKVADAMLAQGIL